MASGLRPEHIGVIADRGHRRLFPGRQVRGAVIMAEEFVDFVVVAGPLGRQTESLHVGGVSQASFGAQAGQSHEKDDDECQGEGDRESDDEDKYR